jgi:hypothetical protein
MCELHFRTNVHNYFHLDVVQFRRLIHGAGVHSILCGWYLYPWTEFTFEGNSIDRQLLDTTEKSLGST